MIYNQIVNEDFENIKNKYQSKMERLKGSRILITGAYGMITSFLCGFLISIAKEYSLVLYLQGRNRKTLNDLYGQYSNSGHVHLLDCSIVEAESCLSSIPFDYIIHAASPASTKAFIEMPVDVIAPNAIGTWNLLKMAKEQNIKKFLLFSSNSIYGEEVTGKTELTEKDCGIIDPLCDRASYIESKRVAEQMCSAYWKQYGVQTSIIRICHTYGPTFDIEKDTRIIPRTIKKILLGEDIEIYNDPHSMVQYTYISDMVSAILLVLLHGAFGEVYNAGGDEIITMNDAIALMLGADVSIKSKLVEKKIDENYNFSQGKGINFTKISNEKIKMLGWEQMISNREGFSRLIKSYLLN